MRLQNSGKGKFSDGAQVLVNFVKIVMTSVCSVSFVLWGLELYGKLLSKPVSSSVSFRYGDDGRGNILFPIVTFCVDDFAMTSKKLACSGIYQFSDIIAARPNIWMSFWEHCDNFEIDQIVDAIKNDSHVTGILEKASFGNLEILPELPNKTKEEREIRFNMAQKYFHSFLHERFGVCWIFDHHLISNSTNLESGPLKLTFGGAHKYFVLSLHDTPQDVMLALKKHKSSVFQSTTYFTSLRKLILTSIPTNETPCTNDPNYSPYFCQVIKAEEIFINQTGCRLPFMQQIISKNQKVNSAKYCKVTKSGSMNITEFFNLWSHILTKSPLEEMCPQVERCKRRIFHENSYQKTNYDNSTLLYVRMQDFNVEMVTDMYTYGIESFVGEIGGTLGLLLGLSFLSIVDFFEFVLLLIAKIFDH